MLNARGYSEAAYPVQRKAEEHLSDHKPDRTVESMMIELNQVNERQFIGIDVSKKFLDIYIRPLGKVLRVANTAIRFVDLRSDLPEPSSFKLLPAIDG